MHSPRHSGPVRPKTWVEAWRADLTRAQAAVQALVRDIEKRTKAYTRIPVSSSLRVRVLRADASGFVGAIRGGESRFLWKRVSADAWQALFTRSGPEGNDALGAACVLHTLERDELADGWLVTAGSSGVSRQAIAFVLSRWRNERVPPGGYVVHAGRYVSVAERDRLLREARIRRALVEIEHKDAETRKAAYAALLELGEPARERFAKALHLRRIRLLDALARDKHWRAKSVKGKLYGLLEERRAHALALIRDKVAYPYPNPTKMGQAEVNARVDQVRQVWERPFELIVGWYDALKEGLAAVTELDGVLVQVDPEHEPKLDRLAEQVNQSVDMSSYTPESSAAKRRAYSLDVLAFNLKCETTANDEERDNVLVVNEYRMMMGLEAVKINERLVRASRGHSRHMREQGYFAHDVPANKGATPQNRTPGARAKVQGYGGGVGENIAMGPGTGRGAFKAWFGSSGHHRNMLGRWTEMGCGSHARSHWTQLFGGASGKSLKQPDPLPEPAPFYAPD